MIDIQAMFPVMVSLNLAEIKQFYETVFGFNAVFYDASFYLHLVSPSSGAQLGFLVPDHASQPPFLHAAMVSEGYAISFDVVDATRAYEQARAMELDVVMELKEEVWGQRHFIIRDPGGFNIDVVQHLEVSGN